MAAYTIEDIELIRQKSGISYKEAVALLDYHNGNVARALVDLERNGRLRGDVNVDSTYKAHKEKKKDNEFFAKLTRHRVLVKDKDRAIVNLPLLFMGALLIFAPHILVVGAVLALIMGCNISFFEDDKKEEVDFSHMVKKAAHSVANTVEQVAKEFSASKKDARNRGQEEDVADAQDGPSYYASNQGAAPYRAPFNSHPDIPTIQVPVNVESREGNVSVNQDEDGSINVTVE